MSVFSVKYTLSKQAGPQEFCQNFGNASSAIGVFEALKKNKDCSSAELIVPDWFSARMRFDTSFVRSVPLKKIKSDYDENGEKIRKPRINFDKRFDALKSYLLGENRINMRQAMALWGISEAATSVSMSNFVAEGLIDVFSEMSNGRKRKIFVLAAR